MRYIACLILTLMVGNSYAAVVQGTTVQVSISATYVIPTCDITMPTLVPFTNHILAGTTSKVSESFSIGVSCSHVVATSLRFVAANVDTSLATPWANKLTVGGAVTNAHLGLVNQANGQYMLLDGSYSVDNCNGSGDYTCNITADILPNGLTQTGLFSEAVVVSVVFN
ncbi:hypothetical protein [Shewanella algae]|uniref:hypothetical protein n=1 Tax=Shewanella algae TaxID=38313 RepID=UPI0031F51138